MPELPDVEGFRRVLAEHGVGRRIERVRVVDPGVLRGVGAGTLDRALRGHRFDEPERHGKWLLAHTDGPTVLLHFGMTGSLHWCGTEAAPHRHDRVIFVLDRGELRYRDMRKLQGVRLAHEPDEVAGLLAKVGPDALSVTRRDFTERLRGRRGRVKSVLTDQSVLAGLGNLLADEILWQARISPWTPVDRLDDARRRVLFDTMRRVLRAAVPTGRVPPRRSWLTGARDSPDAPCPRCGTPLSRRRLSGRGTVWCQRCQPG
ncbi:formamidopyrimidine-DNA glycosylase [Longimycelium tulufanense]|uniref:Formamidopyrimidine-DNA glycosylase n=1 Tax=Longimycelium tulufanense TaxID=907463 RepID=A0A8J3CBY5_9PSEU|nr:Fpg/Nei family DNA glycosylase [Longimycelium tulufanense]GGM71830.1 formamidopyrimidine-DNA glycosylase [Longimycelium tulufanense]